MKRLVITTLCAILLFHAWAIFSGTYYRIWWLDIPMHLAGGAWIGLLFLYLFTERWNVFSEKAPPVPNGTFGRGLKHRVGLFLLLMGFVALAAVLWESYEYLYDMFIAERHGFLLTQQGVSDTMGDLVNGLIGGAVVALVYLRSLKGVLGGQKDPRE